MPVPSCLPLLEEMDMYPADYRSRLVRSKLASFDTQSCDQSFAKSLCSFSLLECEYVWLISFPPTCRSFSSSFSCELVIQLDSQAGQEQAISILEWQISLQEGNGSGNLTHCMALLLPGSDISLRSRLPLVVKYPIAVVIEQMALTIFYSQILT